MKTTLQPLLETAKKEGIFDKAVLGYILPDGTTEILTLNAQKNTVFDLASLTKVFPTSTLALKFILEKQLHIEDKVIDFIPELQTNFRDEIKIFHLLTHSLDYRVPMKTLRHLPAQEILNALFTYQFEIPPGLNFNYGNPASVLLGIILQRLTKKNLHDLADEYFFKPMHMERSGYFPLKHSIPQNEISPTEFCTFRDREIVGETHDESAWVLETLFPVGSAGMFSAMPDLLKFVKMILNDGVFEGKEILPAGILELVSTNAFESSVNACTALGWELNAKKFMGNKTSNKTFGKTGFTGTSIVADAQKKSALILLSNFTYPHREKNADRINAFRAKISDAFFSA